MAPPRPLKYLQIGEITRPHGVRGELRMRIITDYPERIPKLKRVFLAEGPFDPAPRPYMIRSVRPHHEMALLTLDGVDDRDAAERLRNMAVMVSIEDAVPLGENEVYLFELIGMRVIVEDGNDIGEISDIIEAGPNDIYVVRSEQYGEYTIPDVPQFILGIDKAARCIRVRLIEGLLPS